MSKHTTVLTGSPRKNGNSDMLADAFIAGAQSVGHNVVKFATAMKNIKGCKACGKCFTNGTACYFSDDFNELAPILEQTDVLAIVTPLYWFSFPANLKAAIDKIYSFIVAERPLKLKESALIVCGAEEELSMFDGIIKSYDLIANYMNWANRGKLVVNGVYEKGDVQKTDGLKRAEEFGRSI